MIVNDFVHTAYGYEYTVSRFNVDFFVVDSRPTFSREKKKDLFLIFVDMRITGLVRFDLVSGQPDFSGS
jgi:hypothetical protein